MQIFIFCCILLVGGFGLALLLSTLCMGRNFLVGLQVLMGSLRYSKEIDDKIKLELAKVDAGLYHVVVNEFCLEFYSKEKYPDETKLPLFNSADLEIWISNKFFSYGNIYRTCGGVPSVSFKNKRPSVSTIKKIYMLEKNNGVSTKKIKKDKQTSKTEKVVLE